MEGGRRIPARSRDSDRDGTTYCVLDVEEVDDVEGKVSKDDGPGNQPGAKPVHFRFKKIF